MENFKVKTLGEAIANKENINEIGTVFSSFINEGDLAIITGETNVGKSILCGDIAIGNSCKDSGIKYLKQLKSRSSRISSEVAVLEISEDPYLHFDFLEFDQEENHLIKKQESRSSITELMAEHIISLSEEGYSVRTIANKLGISKSVVGRFIKSTYR